MARGVLDAVTLFALPFLVYVGLLLLRRRYPFIAAHWTGGRLTLLAIAGLGLVLVGLLLFGLFVPRRQGAYRPAHVEGGRLVPGHFE